MSINAATNRITAAGFAYDAAGHMTQWPGGTVTLGADYDVEGRLSVVKQDGVQMWRYLYDARNRRVRKSNMSGTMPTYEVHGPGGELLGVYGWFWPLGAPSPVFRAEEERIYFAGRVATRLDETGSPNFGRMDRLGSVKAWQRYPFGEGNESNTYDEYATYPVDRPTGHYYAWNRFYSAAWGRFSSPDPYVMSGGLTNPQGWNRYSYVGNDPVNRYDPRGLQDEIPTYTVNVYAPFPTAALSGAWGDSAEMQELADLPSVVETAGEPVGGGYSRGAEPTPEEEARGYLRAAINMIKQAVDTIMECAALFKGGAVNAKELLDGLADGSVGVIQFGSWLGADAYTQGRRGTEVRFQDGTILYERVDITVNSSRAGSKYWNQVGEVGRARILLHELGHVANLSVRGKGSLFEDNDGEDMEAQKRNQMLEERCFKK